MVFIAYNYNGVPTSIVNARNEELALAYWHGAGVDVFSHKSTKDFIPLAEHPTGVYPLMKTLEVDVDGIQYTMKRGSKLITVHK